MPSSSPPPGDPSERPTASLDPERFARIRAVLREAMPLRGDDRRTCLDRSLADDPILRRLADSLLSRDDFPDFLESHTVEQFRDMAVRVLGEEVGGDIGSVERIGAYRILGKLGEGGMGVVYLAEQQDPQRRVALKVIRGGRFVDETQIRMFRREIDTLARLDHPDIAAIYESGRTEGGRHYFAMELVQGATLREYLAERSRSAPPTRDEIRHRLRLFRRITDAVHYAHQRGVIHRDLKPSNIVVADAERNESGAATSEGVRIRILDFGLARITDADVQATALSSTGTIRGTLPYMSPEQARGDGDALDVRTDVYSLGVVLYEMLSGARPYDVGDGSLLEAIRVISEAKPAPLRTDSHLRRILDPDIETICLKALEKEPDRRYASAAALADDVGRHLGGHPILARPPSTLYQVRKLVARNRIPAALLLTLFVLAIGSSVAMGILWQGQVAERQRAVAEAARTGRLNTFLQGMLESVSPERRQGQEMTVRYLVDGAAARADDELGDDPDLHAEVLQTLGRTYSALAAYDEADTLLHRSLDSRREIFGEESVEVASTLQDLARLVWRRGDLDSAEAVYREALAIDRALGQEERIPVALNNLGAILMAQGRWGDAEPVLRESLDLHRRAFGDDNLAVAKVLSNLGQVLAQQQKVPEAEPLLREGLAMAERHGGEDDPQVAATRASLATLLTRSGRAEEGVTLMRQVVESMRRVYGERHPEVAKALDALGWGLISGKRYDEAVDVFGESLAIYRESLGDEHPQVLGSMAALARGLKEAGRPGEALPLYVESVEVMRRQGAVGRSPKALFALIDLGRCHLALEDHAAAHRTLTEALQVAASMKGDPAWTGVTLSARGKALTALGRFDEAESDLLKASELLTGRMGEGHETTRDAAAALADLYQARGDSERSAAWRAKADPGEPEG